MDAIQNPLYGLQIGSIVTDSGKFGATVVKGDISRFVQQASSVSSMSGTSRYVYSDHMNQGTFSVAGSYGLTGAAKVSGAVAGYVGNTTAKSNRSLEINLNLIKWAGVEHIAFNDLGPAELIAGLQENPRARALAVLDDFLTLQQALEGQEKDDAEADWLRSLSNFTHDYGVGIVVGVLWGGWGTVSLKFTADSKESKWEGGGNAKFSYQGTGAAVDVAATYGHTEDSIGKNATVRVDAFTNGRCVEDPVNKWRDSLHDKANAGLAALGGEPVSISGAMSGSISPPSIPQFKAPSPSTGVADKIGKIESLEGLKTYAIATAYDKYKRDGGTDTLDTFVSNAENKNDVAGVAPIPDGAVSPLDDDDDDDDVLADEPTVEDARVGRSTPGGPNDGLAGQPSPKESPKDQNDPRADYEPLGVWTVGWGQLFPWLVTGHDHRVPKDAGFRAVIQLRTLQQDCLSLFSLYTRIRAVGADDPNAPNGPQVAPGWGQPFINFEDIADAFAHAAATVADFFAQSTSPEDLQAGARKQIGTVIDHLGVGPKKIYETWCSAPALRRCELGAGIVSVTHAAGNYHRRNVIDCIQDSGTGDYPSHLLTFRSLDFDPNTNYTAFSQTVKGWPVILPDGRITLFLSDGDQNRSGFLTAWPSSSCGAVTQPYNEPAYFDIDTYYEKVHSLNPQEHEGVTVPNAWKRLLVFYIKPDHLVGYCITDAEMDKHVYKTGGYVGSFALYPIPFEAARGVDDWKGSSLATGMGNLPAVLSKLRDDLAKMNRWTFDDAAGWEDVHWQEYRYSMQGLRPTYAGVVEEVGNVFPHTQA